MNKYISQVKFNPWGTIHDISFSQNLNIISGTNGTGKTKLLQFIQNNMGNQNVIISEEPQSINISAFSPQRNAQKVLAQQAMNLFRQDINATQTTINLFKAVIPDDNFQTLKSISEYFVYSAEEKVKSDDIRPSEATAATKIIFEQAIKQIFNFDIKFELNREDKGYNLFFEKDGISLSPQNLSHGENAVIVLVCALVFGLDSTETFLIDEPEIHLNWSLEEKLFEFFDWLATEYNKQIIVVTHSRVVFLDQYKGKRQFFERQGQNIVISDKPSEDLTRQIAGDTVQLLQGITSKTKLVYVEDNAAKIVLNSICKKLGLDVDIEIAGDCQKVKNLSKAFKNLQIENVYFLIDGDNKPLTTLEKVELHKNTFQLSKYCIENYLLDQNILNLYRNQNWEPSLQSYINNISVKSNPAIKPVQIALANGTAVSDIIDFIDGSEIFKRLAEAEGKKDKKYELMAEIVNAIPDVDIFTTYFTELDFLKN